MLSGFFVVIKKRNKAFQNIFELVEDIVMPLEDAIDQIKNIAEKHDGIKRGRIPLSLFTRINQGWKLLRRNFLELQNTPEIFEELVPAVKWITDNFYMLDREIKEVRDRIKRKKMKTLPIIEYNDNNYVPRVFVVVKEIVHRMGSHFYEDRFKVLLEAYQNQSPLTIAELWLLPVIIKLCYLESISLISIRALDAVRTKNEAAQKMNEIFKDKKSKDQLMIEIKQMLSDVEKSSDPDFLSHVIFMVRERGINDNHFLDSIVESVLGNKAENLSIIRNESRIQSRLVSKTSILVTGLSKISDLDWREIFQEICVVDEILSSEKCNVYFNMDFDTKNRYRSEIEKIAHITRQEEFYIAKKVLDLTMDKKDKEAHTGYYLIDDGIYDLYENLNIRYSLFRNPSISIYKHRRTLYFVSLSFFSLLLTFAASYYTYVTMPKNKLLFSLIILIPLLLIVTNLVSDLTNSFFIRCLSRRQPPKMNYEKGIPEKNKAIVVLPVIISNNSDVDRYVDKMEKTYLANKDANLIFSILADFPDADQREEECEKSITEYANTKISELNKTYNADRKLIFFFFNRYRKWNDKENKWMGWERKRGKLEEFNRLLKGSKQTSYFKNPGIEQYVMKIKYIITIDSDTDLVRGSAQMLVGTMGHILNKPEFSKDKRRIVKGYGLIQPRMDTRLKDFLRSPFTKMFAGRVGVDPYAYASSDIYQDLFGEGTFVGKGIYDLDVYMDALDCKIPENTVLSHDLLEGSFLRSGLSSDVQLIDDHPANIISFFKREHRWIRGDWQLLPWILGRDDLNGLSRWKMISNLIRSCIPIAYLIYLTLIPFLYNWNDLVYLSIIIAITAFAIIPSFSRNLFGNIIRTGMKYSITNLMTSLYRSVFQIIFMLSIVPYRAYISTDAIIRTIYRLVISKKDLLSWETAEATERKLSGRLFEYVIKMHMNIFFGIIIMIIAFITNDLIMIIAGILFFCAPFYSYIMGKEYPYKRKMLSENEIKELYEVARKTWRYFEELFDPEYNWLIPDNFQIIDEEIVATRTSPTNIGLQLIAFLSARDFGFISLYGFFEMIKKTLSTVDKLKKWHGNLYNWYDINTIEPLDPHYVSSVDSGNFVAFLITLKQGIIDVLNKPIFSINNIKGVRDVLEEVGFEKIKFEDMNIKKIIIYLKDAISEIDDKRNAWINRQYSIIARSTIMGYLTDLDNYEVLDSSITQLCIENNKCAKLQQSEAEIIIKHIDDIVRNTRFNLLFDFKKNLFHTGYNVTKRESDNSYYDLLASEARTVGFLAIAKNEVPKKSWYRLGRPMTLINGRPTLLSWNGTMFEYFMPHLIMETLPKTIFRQTLHSVVKSQIRFASKRKIPFGISESAYYRFDQNLNYQYRAFGVPELGLKADLSKYLVVAPYASILAIDEAPGKVLKNISLLKREGVFSRFGFFDSIDYISPSDSNLKKPKIIKTYMCHHQGMIIAALDNFLHDKIHRKRFHEEPIIKANQFMLEETKLLGKVVREKIYTRSTDKRITTDVKTDIPRTIKDTLLNHPVTHVMSNDTYQIMIDSSGSGYSKFKDRYINIWDSDWTSNEYGNYIYIKNVATEKVYSATYKPTLVEPESYEVNFYPDKAEFIRVDESVETKTEITALSNDNGEIRRLTITNRSHDNVNVEITSYLDVILDIKGSFRTHPVFSKLFVETEYDPHHECIIATRRQRDEKDDPCFLGVTCVLENTQKAVLEYDTDRNYFIGRGNSLKTPAVMGSTCVLRGITGEVVDPCISIRTRIEIKPNEHKSLSFIFVTSEDKESIGTTIDHYRTTENIQNNFMKSLYDSRIEMNYIGLDYVKTNAILDATSNILFSQDTLRAEQRIISSNELSQKNFWKFGISGDNAIILVLVNEIEEIETVKDSVLIYEYMRRNQIEVDLVIINQKKEGYFTELTTTINDALQNVKEFESSKKRQGVFVIKKEEIATEEYIFLLSAADILFTGKDRILGNRIRESRRKINTISQQNISSMGNISLTKDIKNDMNKLRFFNEYGCFDTYNDEYVIILSNGKKTPAPWINVITNPNYGCLASESGLGYTYYGNSRENKITKWANDPVTDDPPEIIYIKDEKMNDIFTISQAPIRKNEDYVIRHGYGYTKYRFAYSGLLMDQTVFVPSDKSFKYVLLSIENKSKVDREISATYYAELVLGEDRGKNMKYIVTEINADKKYLRAYNRYNETYKKNTTYLYGDIANIQFTCDKNEFMGFVQDKIDPPGLRTGSLSGRTGAAMNPCFALKGSKAVKPGKRITFTFMFGQCELEEEIQKNISEYGNYKKAIVELRKIKGYWKKLLSCIKVNTPDEKMNIMLNGWLLYQTISCRILSRSAYYQSGGAFGFRDQLQDCMALFYCEPEMSKQIIINASSHQFLQGDVMHWWHSDTGVGIRTKISDDMLWLPYVLSEYIKTTNDIDILDIETNYLEWEKLADNEMEKYGIPNISHVSESIYIHAKKAITYAMRFGEHGLPLIGAGDWNDGMNRIGNEGKGESVWLGWFLYDTLKKFRVIAVEKEDMTFITKIDRTTKELQRDINKYGWDGEWFLRAFFDDGTKVGTKEQAECKIDLISQSWSVISRAADVKKAKTAMESVKKYLIDENEKMIPLLTPPFNRSRPNPGYIQGYLKGIRENGGQYSHGAVWSIYAYSMLNDNETAFSLFDMLNPISHTEKMHDVEKYKLEPYVASADIYYNNLQKGRGGWSYYTGTAGWLYRAGLELLLGFTKRGDKLYIEPNMPKRFARFSIEYTYINSKYTIHVEYIEQIDAKSILIDNEVLKDSAISLVDDGNDHIVIVKIPQSY